jgi:hypothetical protein
VLAHEQLLQAAMHHKAVYTQATHHELQQQLASQQGNNQDLL